MTARPLQSYDGPSGFSSAEGEIALLRGGEGFSGAISLPLLPDLIQIYTVSLADGALTIRRGRELGTIWFERGDMVHAVCGEDTGEEAVYRMLQWQSGHFAHDPESRTSTRSITASWQNVLMEGCRRIDEAAPDVMSELEDALDGFRAAALYDGHGGVIVQRARTAGLDFAAAGQYLAGMLRHWPTLVDCFSTAGTQSHCLKPLQGGRLLYVVADGAAANVALIRRAVERIEGRLT